MKNRYIAALFLGLTATAFAQTKSVGINTSAPSATLDIVSSGSTNTTKALEVNNSAGTEMVTVLDNGNVGIGTATPQTALHVANNQAYLRLQDLNATLTNGGSSIQTALMFYDQNNARIGYVGIGSANGSFGIINDQNTPMFIRNSAAFGSLVTDGITLTQSNNVGIGTNNPDRTLVVNGEIGLSYSTTQSLNGIKIKSLATEYFSAATSNPTDVIHKFTGFSGSTKAVITEGGNVGIGTTTPAYPLTVNKIDGSGVALGLIRDFDLISLPVGAGAGISQVFGFESGSGVTSIVARIDALGQNNNSGDLRFFTHTGTALTEKMIIKESGNVGIGTTTPIAKLDVAGYVKLGSTDATADAGTAANRQGAIRYTAANGLQYHDATQWVSVASGATAAAADASKDAWVDDAAGTMVKLGTKSDGTTARDAGTEFVALDNGNVGIGTTNVVNKFEVVGLGAPSATSTVVGARFADRNFAVNIGADDANQYGYIHVRERGVATERNLVLNPLNNGNVGIGTTTPTAKLTIGDPVTGGGYIRINRFSTSESEGGELVFAAGTNGDHEFFIDNFGSGSDTMARIVSRSSTVPVISMNLTNRNVVIGKGATTDVASERLVVDGAVRIGTTASTCDAAAAGTIRWTGTAFQGCDGSSWKTLQLN